MILVRILEWIRFIMENRIMIYAIGMLLTLILSYVVDLVMSKSSLNKQSRVLRTHKIRVPQAGDRIHVYNAHTEKYGQVEVIQGLVLAVTKQGTNFTVSEQNTEEAYVYDISISDLVSLSNANLFVLRNPMPRLGDIISIHPSTLKRLQRNAYQSTISVSDFMVQTDSGTSDDTGNGEPVHPVRLELVNVLNSQYLVLGSSHDQFLVELSMVRHCPKRGFIIV